MRYFIYILLPLLLAAKCESPPRVIFDKKSQYNHIMVKQETDGLRTLTFDSPATQTALYPDRPHELILPYTRAVVGCLLFNPAPKKVLIVGLGGGALPSFLRHHFADCDITCVELDPEVIAVAREYFAFREDKKMCAVAGDGREFIEKSKDQYDLIILDAYGPDSIPRALATKEFLEAVKARLTKGGIVASNLPGTETNPLYGRMVRTYVEVFPGRVLLPAPDPSFQKTLIAAVEAFKIDAEQLNANAQKLEKSLGLKFSLSEITAKADLKITSSAQPLLDGEQK